MLTRYHSTSLPAISKREAFKSLVIAWDSAIPREWLSSFCQNNDLPCDLVLSTTVWCYPPQRYFGIPVSICQEVQEAINKQFARDVHNVDIF